MIKNKITELLYIIILFYIIILLYFFIFTRYERIFIHVYKSSWNTVSSFQVIQNNIMRDLVHINVIIKFHVIVCRNRTTEVLYYTLHAVTFYVTFETSGNYIII